MSMLSSMTDRMRTTSSEVKRVKDNNTDWLWRDGITLNDAVRELIDAADTIDYLRNTCNDLQRDYDNLRKAMWDRANARAIDFMGEDELRGLCTDLYDYTDELKSLVRDMYRDMCGAYVGGRPLEPYQYEGRMRELGIDMDDINQSNFQSTKDLVD